VVGVAAAAPATDLSLILSLAPKTAIAGLLAFQVDAGWSWAQTYHDLPASGVFTARGVALAPSLVAGCLDDTSHRIDQQHLQGQDLFVAGLATDPVAVAHARLNDPGRVATTAPLLVVQGSADTTVPAGLTDTYVQTMACPVGDTIDYLRFTSATHGSIPFLGAQTVLTWMADRIAARPAPSTCSLPGHMRTIP
jgi:hypothetical protein